MREIANPGRILLAMLSCAAFLTASALPCPPPERTGHAGQTEHPADCEMHASAVSMAAACPCGCGDRAPMAGSSARIGVALPSAPADLEPPCLAAHASIAAPLLEACFVSPIDHVPLPA